MRRTKIVATLGPSTDAPEVLDAIIDAGIDVARLNASHSGPAELQKRLDALRSAAHARDRIVAVMLDLPGPKLRLGDIEPDTFVAEGGEFTIVPGECLGDATHACVSHPGISRDLHAGDRMLVDDGRIELRVDDIVDDHIVTTVVVGGKLSSHKGVNVPGVSLGVDAITERDRELVAWACEAGVDYVAQSFVRSVSDVDRLRALMGDDTIPIVAKIEKHEAVERLDAIVEAADAVMVARGDLGVELPPEQVPVVQRRIVSVARRLGRPVIIATQMLSSMTVSQRPTRAEASDVANAIFEHVDAVMMSEETAVGRYPVDAVETMARIAMTAEADLPTQTDAARHHVAHARDDVQQAVSDAVVDLAADLDLAAIITPTQSGATARAVSRHRPAAPIIAPTPGVEIARGLGLVWGVTPLVVPLSAETDEMLESVCASARGAGLLHEGDRVAITAGRSSSTPGGTDFVLVRTV